MITPQPPPLPFPQFHVGTYFGKADFLVLLPNPYALGKLSTKELILLKCGVGEDS